MCVAPTFRDACCERTSKAPSAIATANAKTIVKALAEAPCTAEGGRLSLPSHLFYSLLMGGDAIIDGVPFQQYLGPLSGGN